MQRAKPAKRPRLPDGLVLTQLTNRDAVRMVHTAAEKAIVGYGDVDSVLVEARRRERVIRDLFADDPPEPPAETVLAVSDEFGRHLYGPAIIEAFVSPELMEQDRDVAQAMARFHFVLGGMFVDPQARGHGIGRALLEEAGYRVVRHGGRFLDGFVDERNDSVRFYARAGATVRARNRGLPPRPPTRVNLSHPPGVDGHWFYIDGWAKHHESMNCARCRGPLTFHAEDGGSLGCARCGPPPGAPSK